MPHYADGIAAQPGDLVMGHPSGAAFPVVGQVVCVGGETPCTLHVAHPEVRTVGPNEDLPLQGLYFGPQNEPYGATAKVSTGAAADFRLLWRPGGMPAKPRKETETSYAGGPITVLEMQPVPPAAPPDEPAPATPRRPKAGK